jgi:phosphoenolpyruvate carboxykinase (ATP)
MPLKSASPRFTGNELYRRLRDGARWNLSEEELVQHALDAGEGQLTREGALAVRTGEYTGRSPKDKYTVRRPPSEQHVDWTSRFNLPLDPDRGDALISRFAEAAANHPGLYGFRGFIGRGRHRLPVALITEYAWHSLMGRHMYVRPTAEELRAHEPEFTLLYLPSVRARPEDGTQSETVVLCDLERKLGIIGGTEYGGEEKKFFFYLMNYLLPLSDSFPMHCSANVGAAGDVSVLFGLSGTGKTTLSADPDRRLLGDDEHGWDEDGVFNFEGGCYAKLIRLSREQEPLIWNAVNRPGSILENVPIRDGVPDFHDDSVENTRGVYPLEALDCIEPSGRAGHPNTLVFLTFDASGTLPPLSALEENQALYWFLAGYTAKVAGTERGLGAKPEPTFSACFGAPFLPWHPTRYVELLRGFLRRHQPTVILMNTGTLGGPYGAGSDRTPLELTRAMLRAAQSGDLRKVPLQPHPEYGVLVPQTCPQVPDEMLDPRRVWRHGEETYAAAAAELVCAFHRNVNEKFAGTVPAEILNAGPRKP